MRVGASCEEELIIDVVHVLRLLVNKHAFSIGVYFEKTLDHSAPYRVYKKAEMAFDPPKLATAAQTFDDDTQAKCLTFEVGKHNNFVCNGPSRFSAVSDNALRYLRQNRIPITFHDVATTSRAYSSAASLVLKRSSALDQVEQQHRFAACGCTQSHYEASASWRRFTTRRAEKSKYDPKQPSEHSKQTLQAWEEFLMESFGSAFQDN